VTKKRPRAKERFLPRNPAMNFGQWDPKKNPTGPGNFWKHLQRAASISAEHFSGFFP